MVNSVVLIHPDGVTPEELQEVLRVIAAVFYPATPENLPSPHVIPAEPYRRSVLAAEDVSYLLPQFRRDALVGIKRQNPFVRNRHAAQSPVPLLGVTGEGVRHHLGPVLPGDFKCAVGAARINNEDFVRPTRDAPEARGQVTLLVEGKDQKG